MAYTKLPTLVKWLLAQHDGPASHVPRSELPIPPVESCFMIKDRYRRGAGMS